LFEFLKSGIRGSPAGNGDEVIAWLDLRPVGTDDLAQEAADAVAGDGDADFFACDQSEKKLWGLLIPQNGKDKKPPWMADPLAADALKMARFFEPQTRGEAHGTRTVRTGSMGTPASAVLALRVTVVMHFDALWHQAFAARATAAAQDVTTIDGLHSGAETELAFPSALRGLVGAFWHRSGRVKGRFEVTTAPRRTAERGLRN